MAQPIVHQFSLEDFLDEVSTNDQEPVIRMWPGTGYTGGGAHAPVLAQALVNLQYVTVTEGGVAFISQACLIVGSWHEYAGEPFGPRQARRREICRARLQEAEEILRAHVMATIPTAQVKAGSIHTGLSTLQTRRDPWQGWEHIYNELAEAGS